MKEKKTVTMEGTLMYPLRVNECAIIKHRTGITRTSKVVGIHGLDPGMICFETLNTHYQLVPAPRPQTQAAPVRPVMLAAKPARRKRLFGAHLGFSRGAFSFFSRGSTK